jgi:uncharacterized protein
MLEDLLVFAAVGFAAQMIDGAIGMAYGLSATSVLLTLGVAPATASASVHAAEVFTTGASGLAHWRLGNVRRALVLRLAVPGVLGGVTGAYVLVGAPTALVRVFVGLYLLALGGVVLLKALRPRPPLAAAAISTGRLAALGFCGGLLDAIGGGGWGAIVTSTLIGQPARDRAGAHRMERRGVARRQGAALRLPRLPLLLRNRGAAVSPLGAAAVKRTQACRPVAFGKRGPAQ